MIFALHPFLKQSYSRAHAVEFSQDARCLGQDFVLQGPLVAPHQPVLETVSDNGFAVLNHPLYLFYRQLCHICHRGHFRKVKAVNPIMLKYASMYKHTPKLKLER